MQRSTVLRLRLLAAGAIAAVVLGCGGGGPPNGPAGQLGGVATWSPGITDTESTGSTGSSGSAGPTGPAVDPVVTQTLATFTNSAGLLLGSNTLYESTNVAPNRPGIIMMHGCAGAGSSLYDDWGTELAKRGYSVLLVDSFTPRGTTNECNNGQAGVSEANDRPLDAWAGYDYLVNVRGVSAGNVALLGWSHGASSVLATLWEGQVRQPFTGGVVFYAGCGLWDVIADPFPYAPLFMHHGTADATTGLASCTNLAADEVDAKGAAARIAITPYTGAQHSFDNARETCNNGTCTYGNAGGNALTVVDWNAKLAADPVVLQRLLQLTGND